MLDDLKQACKELAQESVKYSILKKQGASDQEAHIKSSKGAWERYLQAGGSRTMINHQLAPEDDFGGQYDLLSKERKI